MNNDLEKYITSIDSSLKEALLKLNSLGEDGTLYVIDNNFQLIGSLTDGDIRRKLIELEREKPTIAAFINRNPHYIKEEELETKTVANYRKSGIKSIPIVDSNHEIVRVIDFSITKSYIPVQALLMAGGLGSRLGELTKTTPKSLIEIGGKSIIDYIIDEMIFYGITDMTFAVRHLKEKIIEHITNRNLKNTTINFIHEVQRLGTLGAASNLENLQTDYILVSNTDLLCKLNFEEFYIKCVEEDADMAVLAIPYEVKVPYGVFGISDSKIFDLVEKPTYTYYSNGGIYLIKSKHISLIPPNEFYNATDLMLNLIRDKKKVISYPSNDLWVDIGKPSDLEKAKIIVSNFNRI